MKNTILIISFLETTLLSAKNYDVSNLTNNDGLSNSSINVINQDSSGLLWFGTWDGLNVYNSREFKVYKPDPGNIQSISNNIIRNIVQEQRNIQWIATDRGINRLDSRKNTFERFFTDNGNQTIFTENSFFIARNSSNRILQQSMIRESFSLMLLHINFTILTRLETTDPGKCFSMWMITCGSLLMRICCLRSSLKKENQNHLLSKTSYIFSF